MQPSPTGKTSIVLLPSLRGVIALMSLLRRSFKVGGE